MKTFIGLCLLVATMAIVAVAVRNLLPSTKVVKTHPRFNRAESMTQLLIIETRDPGGKRRIISDATALKQIQQLLNFPNTGFPEFNAKGNEYCPVELRATFSDQHQLMFSGHLFFYRDRTYFGVNFDEDVGWMSGPTVDVRLDADVDPGLVEELRKEFIRHPETLLNWEPTAGYRAPLKKEIGTGLGIDTR